MTQEMYDDIVSVVNDWLCDKGKYEVVFHLIDGRELAIDAKKFAENQCSSEVRDYVTINYCWLRHSEHRKYRGQLFFVPYSKIVSFELRELWED